MKTDQQKPTQEQWKLLEEASRRFLDLVEDLHEAVCGNDEPSPWAEASVRDESLQ